MKSNHMMPVIEYLGIEQYTPKKYKDDFGSKPNTFRVVAIAAAHFLGSGKIDLALKFTLRPNEEQVRQKAMKLIHDVGIF